MGLVDGPVDVGEAEEEVLVVVTFPQILFVVVSFVLVVVVVVVLVELDTWEVVLAEFPWSSWYTLRRLGPPQYSVELSIGP